MNGQWGHRIGGVPGNVCGGGEDAWLCPLADENDDTEEDDEDDWASTESKLEFVFRTLLPLSIFRLAFSEVSIEIVPSISTVIGGIVIQLYSVTRVVGGC